MQSLFVFCGLVFVNIFLSLLFMIFKKHVFVIFGGKNSRFLAINNKQSNVLCSVHKNISHETSHHSETVPIFFWRANKDINKAGVKKRGNSEFCWQFMPQKISPPTKSAPKILVIINTIAEVILWFGY